jgi:hypothetical protein
MDKIVKSKFITDNIERLNEAHVDDFLNQCGQSCPFPNKTELGYFLKEKFYNEISKKGDLVWKRWEKLNFVGTKIKELANEYFWLKTDLENYLEQRIKNELVKKYESDDSLVDLIVAKLEIESSIIGFKYVKSEFKKVLKSSFNITLQCGFPVNINQINTGVMTANAGDSAQFLFLARAILVGLNCSNVDVRSSRYDAIVDYNNKLYRIQVKGVSGTTISFKDRDRGGQGIDTSHDRNKGKRITAEDCDIYVAVDKTVGLCYLIPMKWVESLPESKIQSVPLTDVDKFKEYWEIFDHL